MQLIIIEHKKNAISKSLLSKKKNKQSFNTVLTNLLLLVELVYHD